MKLYKYFKRLRESNCAVNFNNLNAASNITGNNITTPGNITTIDGIRQICITFNGELNIVNPSSNKFIINGIDIRDFTIGCILTCIDASDAEYKKKS